MTTRKMMFAEALGLAMFLTSPAWAQTEDIYISSSGSGTAGSVSFADEDIVLCDRFGGVPGTCSWSMFFDGSDVGMSPQVDITAFHVEEDGGGVSASSILMSSKTPKKIGDLGKVDDSDIVRFTGNTGDDTAGSFTFFFDGSEVGLTTDEESIDAMGYDPIGRLVVSTDGDYEVPKTGGGTLSGGDEDLIVFNGTTDASGTSGTWELYFNGSDITLTSPQEDVWGAWIDDNTDELFLTTRGAFSITGLSGEGTDIFICDPANFDPITACTTVSGFFVAEDEDLDNKIIDGIFIVNNTSPVAQDDLFTMLEDGVLNENVLADNGNGIDDDVDGDPLTVNTTPVSGPSNGTLALLANGDFTYTPFADFNGTDMYEYEIDDGNGGTDIGEVTITVTAVNDVPSFTKGADETVPEDAGAQNVVGWATGISAGPPDEAGQTLTFNVTGNTNAALFAAGPSIGATGTLSYTAADDVSGSADITIELMDDGGTANGGVDTSAPQTFTITVTAVNDAPSFTKGANETVLEDAGAQTVIGWATGISAGPPDEAGQTLTFNVTGNTNAAMFSAGPSIDATTGTLTYTTAADANGTADVTIALMDNGGTAGGGVDTSAPQMFTINVTAVNDEPSFTKGADETVLEDAGAQTVIGWATGISAGPADESSQVLTFNVTGNTNPALFAVGPSIASNGDLSYTAVADAHGSADITIELMDDGGTTDGGDDTSPTQTFTINVTAVNDVPSFTKGADETVLEDAGAQTVIGWATGISAGPPDEAGQTLTFNVTGNTNAAMFSAGPSIDATTGTLTYTTAADANGTADVTIALMDNGGTAGGGVDTSAPQMFTINVTAVNDVPSFTKGPNQTVQHDAGAQTVNPWATALSTGPADEAGQALTFTITNNTDPSLFSALPAVGSGGVLTYTPQPTFSGTATITLSVMDDGGTANGGVDTSATQMFDITVNTVTPPTANDDAFDSTGNVGIDLSAVVGALFADNGSGADDNGGGTLVVSQVQGNGANVGVATATSMSGSVTANANGSFTYVPAAGYEGADTFTYTAMNAAGNNQATVTINVSDMIWFVDNAASAGDGRLNTPFNTLAAFEAVNGNGGANDPAAGDDIFLYTGSGPYTGGVTLENNQQLIAQGTTGASLASVLGITVPSQSYPLPAINSTRPVVANAAGTAITLGSGNTIRGLNIGDTTSAGISGASVGTATASEASILGNGGALAISGGTLAMTFDTVSSTTSVDEGISLTAVTGTLEIGGGTISTTGFPAVDITGAGGGITLDVTFESVSTSGGTNGIVLDNTGSSGGFIVTGDGSTTLGGNDTGGVIQSTTGDGIVLTDALDVTLQNMTIGDTTASESDSPDATNNIAGDGIQATGVTNLTLQSVTIARTGGHGVNAVSVAAAPSLTNLAVIDSLILNAGDGQEEHGLNLDELRGDNFILDSLLDAFNETGIEVINTSGTVDLTVDGTTFQDNQATVGNAGEEAILIEAQGAADIVVLVTSSIFDDIATQGVDAKSIGATSDVQLTVEDSSFLESNSGDGIIIMNPDGSGSGNVTVRNNTFTDDTFGPFAVIAKNDSSGTLDATIQANTVTDMQLLNVNHDDIGGLGAANGTSRVLVGGVGLGNMVTVGTNNIAVDIIATEMGPVGTDPDVSLTILNNTTSQPDGIFTFSAGLRIQTNNQTRLNANISGNDFQGDPTCCGGSGIELRELDTSIARLEGFGGGNSAAAMTFIDAQNPLSAAASFVTSHDNNIDSGTASLPAATTQPSP